MTGSAAAPVAAIEDEELATGFVGFATGFDPSAVPSALVVGGGIARLGGTLATVGCAATRLGRPSCEEGLVSSCLLCCELGRVGWFFESTGSGLGIGTRRGPLPERTAPDEEELGKPARGIGPVVELLGATGRAGPRWAGAEGATRVRPLASRVGSTEADTSTLAGPELAADEACLDGSGLDAGALDGIVGRTGSGRVAAADCGRDVGSAEGGLGTRSGALTETVLVCLTSGLLSFCVAAMAPIDFTLVRVGLLGPGAAEALMSRYLRIVGVRGAVKLFSILMNKAK